jgi:predicted component of type VI protein secretion system
MENYGALEPLGGGEAIPLLRASLTVGRRESCDIVLRFANISGQHCKLTLESGYWFVQDLNSQNGIKVNGAHVIRKRLDPNDTLAIARHKYRILYSPDELGASGPPPSDEEDITTVLGKSLLERAGLKRRPESGGGRAYEAENDTPEEPKKSDWDEPAN